MKNKIISIQPLNADIAALLLRLIFGGLFIYHGWTLIEHYNEYLPMSQPIIGLSGKLAYHLLIAAQFGCGILVTIGLLTRLAALPIGFAMGVAFFVAHSKDKFDIKELPLLFMLLSLVVFLLGSGRYSIDAMLQKRKPSAV